MKHIFASLAAFAVLFAGLALAQTGTPKPTQPTSTPKLTQPTQPPEIVQFQKIEDQWSDAIEKRDQYGLELVMAPIFVNISSEGEVTTRNQQIAFLFEKSGPQPVSMEQRVVNVRVLEDTALVEGTYIVKWKTNGVVREERGIFTHVYQKARSNWICVHSQRTAVVEKTDTKTKTASKKSNAELPFHIPLIHPGKQSTQPPPAAGSQNDPPQ